MFRSRIARYSLLWGICFFLTLFAFGQEIPLPAHFVRLRSLDECGESEEVLIGALQTENATRCFGWLSTAMTKNKASAVTDGTEIPTAKVLTAETEVASLVWKLEKKDGQCLLRNGGKSLSVAKANSADLALKSTAPTAWYLQENEDGTFTFSTEDLHGPSAQEARRLGLYFYAKGVYYYGVYKAGTAADALVMYRRSKHFSEAPGTAVFPQNGARLLLATDQLLAGRNGKTYSSQPYRLTDGTYATDDTIQPYLAETLTAETFALRTSDDRYLGDHFEETTTPFPWTIINGHLAGADLPHRFVVADSEKFRLLSEAEMDGRHLHGVYFVPAAAPATLLQEGNSLTLRGGWSTTALANLDISQALEINLSALSLPEHLSDFVRPLAPNACIRLSRPLPSQLPASWTFVVRNDTLLRPAVLTDKAPYAFSPFFAAEGMLTYERILFTDGGWETLSLPFPATLPAGYEAETLLSVTREALTFSPTTTLSPNIPVIFRKRTAENGNPPLRLQNTAGMVSASPSASEWRGTNDTLHISSLQDLYLLNGDGTVFLRAATGSYLLPFRACIVLPHAAHAVALRHLTTAIPAVKAPGKTQEYYLLDGRRAPRNARGLLLREQQKIWKP